MAYGVSVNEFWDMSYDEITALVEGISKKQTEEAKLRAQMDFELAYLITIGFNNPKKFPRKIQDAYPTLFEEAVDTQSDIRVHYEQMKQFAEKHNSTHKQGGE